MLNCGELKELLISFHSHFNSYLVRDSRFLWVPELVCILLLTRLSRWQTRVWSQVWSWAQLALIWGAFHHLKMTSPHSLDFSICNSRHFSKLQVTMYWPFFFYYSAVWGFLVCLIAALDRRVVNVSIGLTKMFVQVWKNSNEHFGQPNTKGENQKNTTFLFLPFWLFFLYLPYLRLKAQCRPRDWVALAWARSDLQLASGTCNCMRRGCTTVSPGSSREPCSKGNTLYPWVLSERSGS